MFVSFTSVSLLFLRIVMILGFCSFGGVFLLLFRLFASSVTGPVGFGAWWRYRGSAGSGYELDW